MIFKEVMSYEVTSCHPDTTLESAAILMRDDEGKVTGICCTSGPYADNRTEITQLIWGGGGNDT
jgi:CBS domain-containing protein